MPIFGITASSNMSTKLTDFYQIATTTLGSAQSSIEFTSIPADYTHLQVRFLTKSTYTTGTSDSLLATFNNDSATNYSFHYVRGDGSTASSSAVSNNGGLWLGNQANSGTGTTSTFGVGVCDILDYCNTNKYKTIRTSLGYDANGSGFATFSSSNWRSTSAVTSIKFTFATGPNFAQYSSFQLYGIKG
jgi:hypothetical protein